jgi:hypothetical protein
MMSFAHRGFVFLATTKTGSSAIHRGFRRYSSIEVRSPPNMKHLTARRFEKVWVPVLEQHGCKRETYELVAIIRDPVDWVGSWWRYRSRPSLRGTDNWTGEMTFDEFAERVITGEVSLGRQSRFVTDPAGNLVVERLYRYEHLGDAAQWMAARLGVEAPELKQVNRSPKRDVGLADSVRGRLETHFGLEMTLHDGAL